MGSTSTRPRPCVTLHLQWRLILEPMVGVNYLGRPATTILAGWKRGMISSVKLVSEPFSVPR